MVYKYEPEFQYQCMPRGFNQQDSKTRKPLLTYHPSSILIIHFEQYIQLMHQSPKQWEYKRLDIVYATVTRSICFSLQFVQLLKIPSSLSGALNNIKTC